MFSVRRGQRAIRNLSVCGFILLVSLFVAVVSSHADTAAFDLSGPPVEINVTRAGKTLPISEVPNLQPGDRIWIHPDLPSGQLVHYLSVVVFLQGSTNPPPENWFTPTETWTKQVQQEGFVVTVPMGAQQALLFLAPETGGGFSTLRSAVRGKPGVFVRASQDLNQASFERSRLDAYLNAVKATPDLDPQELKDRSGLLARSLEVKLDQDCFSKPIEQQESCLVQGNDQLLLQDGHSESMVATLTSGPSSDFIGAVSTTPAMAGNFYSPYVGSVVDFVRIMGNIHTAEFQYIPALAVPKDDQLNLRLNSPPSFHNPKSVLVVGLPPIDTAHLPPLRPVDAKAVFCLQKSPLVLPAEGAPLVFATQFGHNFSIRVKEKDGKDIVLPATPDAARGGFVVDVHSLHLGDAGPAVDGTLQGNWGFDSYAGPTYHFRSAHSEKWAVSPAAQAMLVAGRDDTLDLHSDAAACVEKVAVENLAAKDMKATWKVPKTDELEVLLPLQDETSTSLKMSVTQYGMPAPDQVTLHPYSVEAQVDRFVINAGDHSGVLTGTRLNEVGSVELSGVHFAVAKLTTQGSKDDLVLSAQNPTAADSLHPDEPLTAQVKLKDGRVMDVQTTVEAPRPKVSLVNKSIQAGPSASFLQLGNPQELPQDGHLVFVLKSEVPDKFPPSEKVEVATVDGSFDAMLTVADGTLILQDAKSLLANLDPMKSFGPSAFGSLQFRPVDASGDKGDWQDLATLVRIPALEDIRCPASPDKPCTLNGNNLFLIDSVASDSQFKDAVSVPIGYASHSFSVPRPSGTLLYLKLRDDPATVDTVSLPVLPGQ